MPEACPGSKPSRCCCRRASTHGREILCAVNSWNTPSVGRKEVAEKGLCAPRIDCRIANRAVRVKRPEAGVVRAIIALGARPSMATGLSLLCHRHTLPGPAKLRSRLEQESRYGLRRERYLLGFGPETARSDKCSANRNGQNRPRPYAQTTWARWTGHCCVFTVWKFLESASNMPLGNNVAT